jgi:rod shape-determining protein MreD
MVYLIGIGLFAFLAVIQTTIVSRMPLLNGTADLLLLFIVAWAIQDRVESAWQWCLIGGIIASVYSGLPFGTYIAAYLIVTGITRLLKRQIWKAPFLAMLAAVFVGTLVVLIISWLARFVTGVNTPFFTVLNQIILPGLLLNLLLAIPVYSIMHDMAGWLYPEELEA